MRSFSEKHKIFIGGNGRFMVCSRRAYLLYCVRRIPYVIMSEASFIYCRVALIVSSHLHPSSSRWCRMCWFYLKVLSNLAYVTWWMRGRIMGRDILLMCGIMRSYCHCMGCRIANASTFRLDWISLITWWTTTIECEQERGEGVEFIEINFWNWCGCDQSALPSRQTTGNLYTTNMYIVYTSQFTIPHEAVSLDPRLGASSLELIRIFVLTIVCSFIVVTLASISILLINGFHVFAGECDCGLCEQ